MKISYRILLINFAVVVAILASSAIAIYSVMYNTVTSEQSRYLVSSANNFVYNYRNYIEESEDEFIFLSGDKFSRVQNVKNLDFLFSTVSDTSDDLSVIYSGNVILLPPTLTVKTFLEYNPYAVVKSVKLEDSLYYFGRIIDEAAINEFSKRIGSDIAITIDNSVVRISNLSANGVYKNLLNRIDSDLNDHNNFRVYEGTAGSDDIIAAKYTPAGSPDVLTKLDFIIFSKLGGDTEFITDLTEILLLIGLTGVILSLILTMIFTDKIRKQITSLSNATDVIKKGDLTQKIAVKSNDELGQLAAAFNTMLDTLSHNEHVKNEYSEFMTLINRNPSLTEISEAALANIIKTCGYSAGALYLKEDKEFRNIASNKLDIKYRINDDPELFKKAAESGEILEIYPAESTRPTSDFISDQFSYLIIIPVVYNSNVIAVMEFGSISEPSSDAREFIAGIQEQLAIGLSNALAFMQLENVIDELQKLNDDYQKQNLQVRQQNEKLIELHRELKEQAEELVLQKQKAEESTQLKSQFLASMSHELRTPMNSILGLSELILEDQSLAGKNRERLDVVLKSGKRLMHLINGILDLSKIEAGKLELHEEEILLEELVSEIETSVSPLFIHKNLEFRLERNTDTNVLIKSDRGKLLQILINLLGNAIKFTEKGFVELIISTPGPEVLQFDINDTGIGISDRDQQNIFEEFRQADGSTTRKYDGTGLGLTISSRLCKFMKGNISLRSKLGEGSTFTVQIPVQLNSVSTQSSGAPVNIEVLVKNRKNPILVIDDDEEVQNTIGHYLNSKGYDVVFAENGYNGVNEAVRIQPFAITLDLMLPHSDGWTTLRELKENPLTKDIPVILISILGDKQAGYGLGAFEYFLKPISQSEFISAISKLENLAQKRIERIVIVDDDELEFEKFRGEFSSETLRIDYIKDSELAFSKILEIQPDLVVIDLLMPYVDGITLSHKLKMNRETRHIPIIISTAKDLSDAEKDSLNNIVENITVKSKGHPLDVLKIVRDRIRMQEINAQSFTPKQIDENNIRQFTLSQEPEISAGPALEVLIVDDDADSLYTIDEIVKSCDCKTTLAKSGAECLKILEGKTPDLILLDIMMPEMDGFQVLKSIRSIPELDNIQVYAVTAKAMVDDKAVIIKYGFDDYIFKPVNSGMLAFKLKRLLYKIRVNQ